MRYTNSPARRERRQSPSPFRGRRSSPSPYNRRFRGRSAYRRSSSRERGRRTSRHQHEREIKQPRSAMNRSKSHHARVTFSDGTAKDGGRREYETMQVEDAKGPQDTRYDTYKAGNDKKTELEGTQSRGPEEHKEKEVEVNLGKSAIAVAMEKAFECLQAIQGEINLTRRMEELNQRLARKEGKRKNEAEYKASLEETISKIEQQEPGISDGASLHISQLKSEAEKMLGIGELEQVQRLRTEAINESASERERKDITTDELRRLRREVHMLQEEITTYDDQITESKRELSIARSLHHTLLASTEVPHEQPGDERKKRKMNDCSDKDGDGKKRHKVEDCSKEEKGEKEKQKEGGGGEGTGTDPNEELNYEI